MRPGPLAAETTIPTGSAKLLNPWAHRPGVPVFHTRAPPLPQPYLYSIEDSGEPQIYQLSRISTEARNLER